MDQPPFLPGSELSGRFYREAVAPLLERVAPGLRYAAAHVGPGSDVLGLDTALSRDHDWGPAVHLFLRPGDLDRRAAIDATLERDLPARVAGYEVRFPRSHAPDDVARHHVTITTVARFARRLLAFDITREIEPADWLTCTQQALLELTAGTVHVDMTGELTGLRERLAWYPHDLWLYLMACAWERIGEEEHLMPRAGSVGDELGAAIIGSRLVRSAIILAFLMERRYAPYAKWLGTAFARLDGAANLAPPLTRAQHAERWPDRLEALNAAFSVLARMHNALGLTAPLPVDPSPFFGRPWSVIGGSAFAAALIAEIREPAVRAIAARGLVGSIDLFSDNVDLHEAVTLRARVRALYE